MRIGIATDHGGFGLKEELVGRMSAAGHEVVDFGAHNLNPDDDLLCEEPGTIARPLTHRRWQKRCRPFSEVHYEEACGDPGRHGSYSADGSC